MAESPEQIGDRESDFTLTGGGGTVRFQPNHSLMARPRRRELDNQLQRTFFYTRLSDNRMLHFTEQEAAMMMKSSHAMILKQIGCSDGSAYAKYIRECGVKPGQEISREKAQEILKGALEAEIASAKGNFANPQSQHVHFDSSFPLDQRPGFQPPP